MNRWRGRSTAHAARSCLSRGHILSNRHREGLRGRGRIGGGVIHSIAEGRGSAGIVDATRIYGHRRRGGLLGAIDVLVMLGTIGEDRFLIKGHDVRDEKTMGRRSRGSPGTNSVQPTYAGFLWSPMPWDPLRTDPRPPGEKRAAANPQTPCTARDLLKLRGA